jgi:hypothetical protein
MAGRMQCYGYDMKANDNLRLALGSIPRDLLEEARPSPIKRLAWLA